MEVQLSSDPVSSVAPAPDSIVRPGDLVLVTGGTGFVGSHIVYELLKAGYRVRATTRPRKAESFKGTYAQFGDAFEVFIMEDIATGDFSEAMQGVDAVIHTASPVKGDQIIRGAIGGTANILTQAAESKGLKKVVITSSAAALKDVYGNPAESMEGGVFDENSWANITLEEALDESRPAELAYWASKPIAERMAWSASEQLPNIDMTTIVMPFVYGSFVPNYALTKSPSSLGSNALLYSLITRPSKGSHQLPDRVAPFSVDVKDVAKAHVASLLVPTMPGTRKRLLVSHGGFTWKEAADFLRVARPELAPRLPVAGFKPLKNGKPYMNCSLTSQLIGLREEDYIPWQKTLLSAMDAILGWERRSQFVHPRMVQCRL